MHCLHRLKRSVRSLAILNQSLFGGRTILPDDIWFDLCQRGALFCKSSIFCTALTFSVCLPTSTMDASDRQNSPDILHASIGLMTAIDSGDLFAVGHRLTKKADPNTTIRCNGTSATALCHACAQRRYPIAQALLQAKANPNTASPDGVTPLMEAVKAVPEIGSTFLVRKLKAEQIPAVQALLAHNADPALRDEAGKRAHDYTTDEALQKLLETTVPESKTEQA